MGFALVLAALPASEDGTGAANAIRRISGGGAGAAGASASGAIPQQTLGGGVKVDGSASPGPSGSGGTGASPGTGSSASPGASGIPAPTPTPAGITAQSIIIFPNAPEAWVPPAQGQPLPDYPRSIQLIATVFMSDGSTSSAVTWVSHNKAIAPSVSAFSPTTAEPNTLVRITGMGFSPSNQVTIGGAPATVLLATPTEIVAQVPASAITGKITVKTGRGTVTTSANITVKAPTADSLAITGFNPAAGRPDTVVTLSGAFFVGATPSVTFAAPANQAPIYAEVTAFATDSISVIVPRGAENGRISVITPTVRSAPSRSR